MNGDIGLSYLGSTPQRGCARARRLRWGQVRRLVMQRQYVCASYVSKRVTVLLARIWMRRSGSSSPQGEKCVRTQFPANSASELGTGLKPIWFPFPGRSRQPMGTRERRLGGNGCPEGIMVRGAWNVEFPSRLWTVVRNYDLDNGNP